MPKILRFGFGAFLLCGVTSAFAQVSPLEERLLRANIVLTEVDQKTEMVRDWLVNDAAYRELADRVLKLVGKRRVLDPIPLEVINGKYKVLLGVGYDTWVPPARYDDIEKIRKAIYKTWKERKPLSSATGFDQIFEPQFEPTQASGTSRSLISIHIAYPSKDELIPRADFSSTGKVVSRVQPSGSTYIYSLIKTDKYYRQDSQPLTFSKRGDSWDAFWELDLILGRPADIGLEGTVYLFVTDKENRRKLVKHYMYPQEKMHSKSEITSLATSRLAIERSIPE